MDMSFGGGRRAPTQDKHSLISGIRWGLTMRAYRRVVDLLGMSEWAVSTPVYSALAFGVLILEAVALVQLNSGMNLNYQVSTLAYICVFIFYWFNGRRIFTCKYLHQVFPLAMPKAAAEEADRLAQSREILLPPQSSRRYLSIAPLSDIESRAMKGRRAADKEEDRLVDWLADYTHDDCRRAKLCVQLYFLYFCIMATCWVTSIALQVRKIGASNLPWYFWVHSCTMVVTGMLPQGILSVLFISVVLRVRRALEDYATSLHGTSDWRVAKRLFFELDAQICDALSTVRPFFFAINFVTFTTACLLLAAILGRKGLGDNSTTTSQAMPYVYVLDKVGAAIAVNYFAASFTDAHAAVVTDVVDVICLPEDQEDREYDLDSPSKPGPLDSAGLSSRSDVGIPAEVGSSPSAARQRVFPHHIRCDTRPNYALRQSHAHTMFAMQLSSLNARGQLGFHVFGTPLTRALLGKFVYVLGVIIVSLANAS